MIAGLKKCIPNTLDGILQTEAIEAIDKDDVLLANTQLAETIVSKSENNFCFTAFMCIHPALPYFFKYP